MKQYFPSIHRQVNLVHIGWLQYIRDGRTRTSVLLQFDEMELMLSVGFVNQY